MDSKTPPLAVRVNSLPCPCGSGGRGRGKISPYRIGHRYCTTSRCTQFAITCNPCSLRDANRVQQAHRLDVRLGNDQPRLALSVPACNCEVYQDPIRVKSTHLLTTLKGEPARSLKAHGANGVSPTVVGPFDRLHWADKEQRKVEGAAKLMKTVVEEGTSTTFRARKLFPRRWLNLVARNAIPGTHRRRPDWNRPHLVDRRHLDSETLCPRGGVFTSQQRTLKNFEYHRDFDLFRHPQPEPRSSSRPIATGTRCSHGSASRTRVDDNPRIEQDREHVRMLHAVCSPRYSTPCWRVLPDGYEDF